MKSRPLATLTFTLASALTALAQQPAPGAPPERPRGGGFGGPIVLAADDVRAFPDAPNTRPPAELVPDPAAVRAQVKLLYISCGNKDGLISISQGMHRHLREQAVPHLWNVDDFGHDPSHWASNLFHFAQRLFR